MKQKSAGQSASKIFLSCGFMLRYVRTPNGKAQQLATNRLPIPKDAIASLLQRRVRRYFLGASSNRTAPESIGAGIFQPLSSNFTFTRYPPGLNTSGSVGLK